MHNFHNVTHFCVKQYSAGDNLGWSLSLNINMLFITVLVIYTFPLCAILFTLEVISELGKHEICNYYSKKFTHELCTIGLIIFILKVSVWSSVIFSIMGYYYIVFINIFK